MNLHLDLYILPERRALDLTISCQNANGLLYQMPFKKFEITVCLNFLDDTETIMSAVYQQNQR